jgi:hypothetical protein
MKIPPELLTVARYLGYLKEKTVFVGGMIRGLLITDPAAGAARSTDDVDLIVDVPSYQAFTDFNQELRGLGFNESMEEGAPICRWVVAGIRTDIMPIDPCILGFTNVWYSGAMDHPAVIRGPTETSASSTPLTTVRPSWKPSQRAATETTCIAISKISLPSSTADRR